jgi:hypothetical protein
MQQIDRLFGFRIKLDETLDPYRIDVLKEQAALIVARHDFDPEQYHLYFHQLTIILRTRHFAGTSNIRERIEELRLTFARNPKQDRDRAIRFYNHLLEATHVEEVPSTPTESAVTYHLSGEYLAGRLKFRNELITFISKDLRKDHRKIKISIHAFPTPSFRERLRTRRKKYITKLDLRYERYTPVRIPGELTSTITTDALRHEDRELLVAELARLASSTPDPVGYFRDLVDSLDIPREWKWKMAGVWDGDALSDARDLVRWAESREVIAGDHQKATRSVLYYVALHLAKDGANPRIEAMMAAL